MISLHGKGDKAVIRFTRRPGWNGSAPLETERPLIYGHVCPFCKNVIQALFRTEVPVSLRPYEETAILYQRDAEKMGTVKKIVPSEKDGPDYTCYNIERIMTHPSAQKIVLRNHVLRHRSIVERKFNGEGLWETGERPCLHTGIFALREDLLLKDLCMFSSLTDTNMSHYNLPKTVAEAPRSSSQFTWVDAVGAAPPMVLVERMQAALGFPHLVQEEFKDFARKQETKA